MHKVSSAMVLFRPSYCALPWFMFVFARQGPVSSFHFGLISWMFWFCYGMLSISHLFTLMGFTLFCFNRQVDSTQGAGQVFNRVCYLTARGCTSGEVKLGTSYSTDKATCVDFATPDLPSVDTHQQMVL